MTANYPLYINADFLDTPERQKIISPATQEIIAEVAVADKENIALAINSARSAFDQGPWPKVSNSQRKAFLLKISQGILDKAKELAELESQNTGKPIKETTFMDIPSAAKTFEYFAHNLEKYLGQEILELENARSYLVREPVGVVVLIVPWNYPLLIASWKLAQALACGNTVILKPSSLTPLSVLELAKIIHNIGIPKGVVNIINAPGATIGEPLCSDKRIDMISFTGSNEVGREIIQGAAKNVKKLIMELGGKSANIVLADCDLDLAINGSLCAIFLNQGQMCTAMSRLLIQEDIYDGFLDSFVQKAKRIELGLPLDYQTQMGPLISADQLKKVKTYVEKAKEEGANVLCGGKSPPDVALSKGFFFEPTVISEVTPDMTVFKEEIFGPVVSVCKFSEVKEAIELANKSDFGLAACIWTKDEAKATQVASKINAGTIWVNTYGMFYNEVPYGGFKQSGFGKELGKEGFLEYTRLKNVFFDRTLDARPLVNYWYGF